MTLGPDGRLYVLGAQDSAATELRLDVLDAASGRIEPTQAILGPAGAGPADSRTASCWPGGALRRRARARLRGARAAGGGASSPARSAPAAGARARLPWWGWIR